jgi:1,4-dihydroxy-2-naphthoate octaprenyltransferase
MSLEREFLGMTASVTYQSAPASLSMFYGLGVGGVAFGMFMGWLGTLVQALAQ